MFSTMEELQREITKSGYLTDPVTLSTIFLAARLHKPLLLEGPAGSGKTQLAYAVAAAAETTVERLQCYEGVNEEKAIGKFDESLQRLCVELKAKSADTDWAEMKKQLHGGEFFSAGPLLSALRHDKPCVLLIDELDKVSPDFEAQSFKRAASCFGLGRYLYYFAGVWVDLDNRKRPKSVPTLFSWATPEGWRNGQRPTAVLDAGSHGTQALGNAENQTTVREIEAMAEPLGRGLYRGLLRDVARVWNPSEIQDISVRERVLEQMHAADRGLRRLEATLNNVGSERLIPILRSMGLSSVERVDTLDGLKRIVAELERQATRQI